MTDIGQIERNTQNRVVASENTMNSIHGVLPQYHSSA